ncbi:Predicted membrane protein [Chryseobacterium carnipullorum]|nr:Predicted membrane protein [Chryseobacterium carnipullorum]
MLSVKKNISSFFKTIIIIGFGYFFWLMLKITLEYIPLNPNVSFLMIKQTEVQDRPEYLSFFYTHVYTSIFVLFFGFLAILRKDFGIKNFHRNIGKVYIFLILILAAPSGIYMGFFANGGKLSKISFVILGSLWWFSTYKAYQSARQKRFKEHKQWMWRSFALTLSALTLRIWKVIIVYLFHPNPMDVYQIIAWLGWIPNILLIEYLITKKLI